MRSAIDWSRLDGHTFQELCTVLLRREGFDVQDQGVGPDGGIDIIAEQNLLVHDGYAKRLRWAVQAKHKAMPSHTVKPGDLGNIGNLLARFSADGYMLITNGRVTSKTFSEIRSVTLGGPPSHLATVWDSSVLMARLSKHADLLQRYFGVDVEKTVLVVDDAPFMAQAVSEILTAVGHAVHVAHSAEEAKQLIDRQAFDVAILDIRLDPHDRGDADGFAVADLIRRKSADTRIVYHSGYMATPAVAVRAKADDAIVLPKSESSAETLRTVVRDAMTAPVQYVRRSAELHSVEQLMSLQAHQVSGLLLTMRLSLETLRHGIEHNIDRLDVVDRLLETVDRLHLSVGTTRDELLQLIGDQRNQQFVIERVGAIVQAALTLRATKSKAREDVSIEVADDLSIECHGPSVRSALVELVANADQALASAPLGVDDGRPLLSVSAAGLLRERPFVEIRVSDRGGGFSADALRHGARPGFSTKPGGTGLGLRLVAQTAELHGGWLDVQSPHGEWSSSVALILPARKDGSIP